MRRSIPLSSMAAIAFAAAATPASAATLLEINTPTGATASGTDIDFAFDAAAGAGSFDVVLDAFGSVDGVGSRFKDTFSIALNGAEIFSGSFRLGGGGHDRIFLAPTGSSVTPFNRGNRHGGTLSISSPVDFLAGTNNLSFSFAATGHDEFFGVNSLAVNGAPAVPEPGTWAMMLIGFGALGFAMRRKKQTRIRVAYA